MSSDISSKPEKKKPRKASPPPMLTREELLATIWLRTAEAVAKALAAENPSAATIIAARQFLADQGVSLDTLPNLQRKGPRGGLGLPDGVVLPFTGAEAEAADAANAPTEVVEPPSHQRAGSIAWHKPPTGNP